MLKKFMGDPSLIVPTENVGTKDSLSYEYIPVQILDHQVRKLITKEVADIPWFHGIINTFSLSLVCPKAFCMLIFI